MSVVRWTIGLAIMAYCAAPAMAQSSIQTAFNYNLQDEAGPAGTRRPAAHGGAPSGRGVDHVTVPASSLRRCGCEASCGCENGCCNRVVAAMVAAAGATAWAICCLGDAWTLQSCLTPCCDEPDLRRLDFRLATTTTTSGSRSPTRDELSFNDFPDHLTSTRPGSTSRSWPKPTAAAATGVTASTWSTVSDAQKTQAFGNDGGTWDVTLDHGTYGWAIPQAYGEVGLGRLERQGRSLLHAARLRSGAGHRQLLLQPFAHDVTTASRLPTPACWAPTRPATR